MSNHNHSSSGDHCENSFIAEHQAAPLVFQVCDGTEITFFEDFTDNHHLLLISFDALFSPPCRIFVTIKLHNGKKIKRELQNEIATVIQVEDVQKITIRGEGNSNDFFFVEGMLQKTFCICCDT